MLERVMLRGLKTSQGDAERSEMSVGSESTGKKIVSLDVRVESQKMM